MCVVSTSMMHHIFTKKAKYAFRYVIVHWVACEGFPLTELHSLSSFWLCVLEWHSQRDISEEMGGSGLRNEEIMIRLAFSKCPSLLSIMWPPTLCVSVCSFICAQVYVEARVQPWASSIRSCPPCFLTQNLSLLPGLPDLTWLAGWYASGILLASIFCAWITSVSYHIWHFTQMMRIKLLSSSSCLYGTFFANWTVAPIPYCFLNVLFLLFFGKTVFIFSLLTANAI